MNGISLKMNFMQMTSECPKVYLVWEMGDSDNEVTSRNLTVVTAIRARSSQAFPFLTKPVWLGGKTDFPIILHAFPMPLTGAAYTYV